MYQFSIFYSLFQFLSSVSCAIINEMLSFVYDLTTLLLFDESKGGEKLKLIKLDKLKLELDKLKLEFNGIEPILLIEGACASVCAYYLVYIALGSNFQVHKLKLRCHSSIHPTKWKKVAMEVVRCWLHQIKGRMLT